MRILWFRARGQTACFNGPLEQEIERILGKENVVFASFTKEPPYITRTTNYRTYFRPFVPAGEDEKERVFPLAEIGAAKIEYEKFVNEVKPDVIIIDRLTTDKSDFGFPNIPKVSFLVDAHSEWFNKLDRAKAHQLDFIFTKNYGGGIGYRIKKDMGIDVGFLPFYAPSEYKDLGMERENKVFLSGCCSEAYPLRLIIYRTQNLDFYNEGVDGSVKLSQSDYIVNLNRFKILATEGGIFRYSVAKIFEGMACGIFLLMDSPMDAEALRFEVNVNYAELKWTDFEHQFKYWFEHDEERKRIAKNGYDLIQKYHTVTARAEQMIAQLEEVINAKREGRRFDYTKVQGEAGRQLTILNRREQEYDSKAFLHRAFENRIDFQSYYTQIEKYWEGYWVKAYEVRARYVAGTITLQQLKEYFDQYYDRKA
jgi:hypothetical protein